MNIKVDDLLPSAVDMNKKMAEAEAAKASEYIRKQQAVEAEKKALLDKLVPPWMVLATSIVLILFAEFCFVAGVWRELAGKPLRPNPDTTRFPAWLLLLFNGFLLLDGAAVLVGIATG